MKALTRKCLLCRFLARLYEEAIRRSEKGCVICARIAFILSLSANIVCAEETGKRDAACIGPVALASEQIVIQLPNTPLCWLFTKLTGRDPPTPRTFAVALANGAASASGATVRFR